MRAYVKRAELACQIGTTDFELAELFEVSVSTINNWKSVHPEFADALRTGKAFADERVERALYHRAIGYSYDAEEVFQYQGKIIRTNVVTGSSWRDGSRNGRGDAECSS